MQAIELTLVEEPGDVLGRHAAGFAVFSDSKSPDSIFGLIETLAEDHRCGRSWLELGDLFAIPTNGGDLTAMGLVWIARDGQAVEVPVGSIPLCLAVKTLWIPTNARIDPIVAPEILAKQFAGDSLVRVWLPSLGVIGFGTEDSLGPSDWLAAPARADNGDRWTSPPEAWRPPGRLIELSLASPDGLDAVLGSIALSIDKPAGSLLDASARDLSDGQPSGGKKVKRWLLEKLDSLAKPRQSPAPSNGESTGKPATGSPAPADASGAGGSGASDASGAGGFSLGSLTAPLAGALSRMLQRDRDAEIQKLLDMMRKDPDRALAYAIPIGGITEAFRGFAMPGSALMSRLTDFSLSGLSGGSGNAVDPWTIDHRLQWQLHQRYRDQANREMSAGRYRRAAYIFAHLLGDFRGAAEVLQQGKFFAEAAVLYRDRLGNRRKAAQCFRDGGLYRDAAELYESMQEYELAANALLEAGLESEAIVFFERAVETHLGKGAVISAARLMNQPLGRRAEAIDLLCDQWPAGNDVLKALGLAAQWIGQDGDHARTLELLDQMRRSSKHEHSDVLVALTHGIAKSYPDRVVRRSASDLCRIGVSRVLASLSPLQCDEALQLMQDLDVGDAQLRRDANAHARTYRQRSAGIAASASDTKPTTQTGRDLVSMTSLFLPSDAGTYVDVWHEGKQIFALVQRDDEVSLVHSPDPAVRGGVNRSESARLSDSGVRLDRSDAFISYVLRKDDGGFRVVAYAPVVSSVVLGRRLGNQEPAAEFELVRDGSVVAACGSSSSNAWQLEKHVDGLVLRHLAGRTYDLTGPRLEAMAHEQSIQADDFECQSLAIALVQGEPVVALDYHLFAIHGDSVVPIGRVPGSIRSMAASMKHTRHRVAVAHSMGLSVIYLDSQEMVILASDVAFTHCLWTYGAKLVAISEQGLHCFESRGGFLRQISVVSLGWISSSSQQRSAEAAGPANVVSILRLDATVVGVVYETGQVKRYRLPK